MNDEPSTTPINEDDNQPATQGLARQVETSLRTEIREVASTLRTEINGLESSLRTEIEGLDQRLIRVEKNMATKDDIAVVRREMTTMKDEIIHEFKALAENIHQDVATANQDEISLIKDQQLPDHEDRLRDLEEHTGLTVGSRYSTS